MSAQRQRWLLGIALLLAAIWPQSANAQTHSTVYKWQTPQGEVVYRSTCRGCTMLGVVQSTQAKSVDRRQSRSTGTPAKPVAAPTRTTPPKNHNRFDDHILEASDKYGVPFAFIKAVIHVESHFNPRAKSHVGAQGLMQLMPGTARELGVADPWNPKQNIDGGARYLRHQIRKYDGDINRVLAAYNAGGGNVDKYGGIPWRRTRQYVTDVYHWYKIYRKLHPQSP